MISIEVTYQRCGLQPSVAQLAFAKASLGETLTEAEIDAYVAATGRESHSQRDFFEVIGLMGRKSGKTSILGAPILAHRACTDADEPGTYLFVAPSKSDQARLAWESVLQLLQTAFPGLIASVSETDGRIRLHNQNEIKIASADFRTLRGPKYKVAIADEACFFHTDDPDEGGANPLEYVLDSVVGGMIATERPLLLLLSTPWTKAGTMYEHWRDRDANPDRLVWQADTLTMNPFANQALMAQHKKDRGESFFHREYLAEFSEDSEAFLNGDDVDAAVDISGILFFAPRDGLFYHMGLDPARTRDHFGAAIGHREGDMVVVDWAREWKPGALGLQYRDVLPEIWRAAREYGIRRIASDQIDFGGIEASIPTVNGYPEFIMERIMTGGQAGAVLADVTRALFANRKLILPAADGLAEEFKRLTNYLTQGGGRDIRAKRGHDDRSRACMLAIHQAFSEPPLHEPLITVISFDKAEDDARMAADAEERERTKRLGHTFRTVR